MDRCFLIVHGLTGSGPRHWQTWLAQRLREDGEDVRFPELPQPFSPQADAWAPALHGELATMSGDRTVLCHSLGSLLWAREAAAIAPAVRPERLVLVAPPCPRSPLEATSGFFPVPLDAAAMADSARAIRVVAGTDDPYCPDGAVRSFAGPLGLPCDILAGGAHLNADSGYGPWPALRDWCVSNSTGPIAGR